MTIAADSIIAVSKGGRGFLVETRSGRLVITAAHCLPRLPPAHPAAYTEERTYPALLGLLGVGEPSIWAECLFADPVADLAVLCEPDNQELADEADAYCDLVDNRPTLPIGLLTAPAPARLLGRDGQWADVTVQPKGRLLSLTGVTDEAIARGTSGSPILTVDGVAVGVISTGSRLNPALAHCLPGWLLTELGWQIAPPSA